MQKHKLLSFLLALIAAVGLWVYAVTVVNPDDVTNIYDVRVRFVGTTELEMNQLMLTGGEVQYVDMEISGRRSDLKELSSSSVEAIADLSKIDGPGTYELSWTLDPPASVASGDIKLVSSSANKITVKISEYKVLPDIPVQIEYKGAIAQGYVRDPAMLSTQTVSVSGPAEEVERIAAAKVLVDLKSSKTTLEQELEYSLVDENGESLSLSSYVSMGQPTVGVTVPVYCYKQIDLELELIPGGGATAENVKYTIDPPSIGVVGSEEALAKLKDTLVIKRIELEDVTQTLRMTVTPEFPAGVSNRDAENSVVVTLQLVGLSTRKIYVDCAQIERINDDPALDFGVARIPITVRGKTSEVYAMSSSMLRISADMKNDYDPETRTLKLTVSLVSGSSCGILGEYSVPLIEKVEETGPDETTRNR